LHRIAVRRHWKLAILVVAVVLGLALWLAPAVAAILMLGLVGAVFVLAWPASLDIFVRGPGYQYRDDVPSDDDECGLDVRTGTEPKAGARREDAPASITAAPVRAPASAQDRLLSWPSTRDGMRAAKLSLAVLGLVLLDRVLAAAGYYDESRTGALGVMVVVGFAIVFGAIAADLRAIRALRSGDRSIVLLLPLLPTAAAAIFLVREVVLPN
jgi:hypothetical protein